MKEIYIIRHGQTDYNLKGIVQGGGVDSDLNSKGVQQAQAFYNHYQHKQFEYIFTSALKRTVQTVKPFLDTGIPYESTPDINEMNWGIHEGEPYAEWMKESYDGLINQWQLGNLDARIPEGESGRELISRLSNFVDHLRTVDHQSLLVCTHGRAIKCLMTILKNEEAREMEKYGHTNTGLWKVVHVNDSFLVKLENNTDHLEE